VREGRLTALGSARGNSMLRNVAMRLDCVRDNK
jgi:hypothetical protein